MRARAGASAAVAGRTSIAPCSTSIDEDCVECALSFREILISRGNREADPERARDDRARSDVELLQGGERAGERTARSGEAVSDDADDGVFALPRHVLEGALAALPVRHVE